MTMCGNVKHTRGGKVIERCPNNTCEGSMYCEACKAIALERVKRFSATATTIGQVGLKWPRKDRA